MQVINGHHPIIVSGNPDSAFHFQLLVLVMVCENSCFIFFMMVFFLLQIHILMHVLHVYPHNLNLPF